MIYYQFTFFDQSADIPWAIIIVAGYRKDVAKKAALRYIREDLGRTDVTELSDGLVVHGDKLPQIIYHNVEGKR